MDPPGQTRPWPKASLEGDIPFAVPPTGEQSHTHYWLWGNPETTDKTPLICLHGGPGAPGTYLRPISLLYEDYGIPVLLYDQIGCGESTHFKDRKFDTDFWTPELFMAELDNVKKHLGIERYDLLGQSWGGMLAAQYAIAHPKGLRKLLICDSPASMKTWVEVCNKLRAELPAGVQAVLDRCESEGNTSSEEYETAVLEFYRWHLCRVWPFPDELATTFDYLREDNTVYETMNGPSEFYVVGSLKTWDITAELHKLTPETVPGGILLVNGHYDEAQDEVMEPYFSVPSARVKWVRFGLSSHMPQLDETEAFVKALELFLASA